MGMQTHHILSQEERERLDAIALYFERERAREKLLAQAPTYSRVHPVSTQSTRGELSTQSARLLLAVHCEHDCVRFRSVGTTLLSLAAYRNHAIATCRNVPQRAHA
jgi:hypothetical protein